MRTAIILEPVGMGNKQLPITNRSSKHIAIPGFVYGGLIASFVDCHGTGSAALALHRKNGNEPGSGEAPPRFVTASLNVNYVKPTPQGALLKAVGTVEEIHPKKWKVSVEVFADDTLCRDWGSRRCRNAIIFWEKIKKVQSR